MRSALRQICVAVFVSALAFGSLPIEAYGQARRVPPQSQRKRNQRPDENQPKQGETQAADEPVPPDIVNTQDDADEIAIKTTVVNVDVVVYNKKTGQIVTGLRKDNFKVYEDGQEQAITNFSTPEAPITVAVILEYSKRSEQLNANWFDIGIAEVMRPTATFLTQFVRPPDDFVSVIAYDMRPTPITDFTNDPRQIATTVNLLLRNRPAFTETNLFDALKFTLVGGRGDSEILPQGKPQENRPRTQEYGGLAELQNRRKAVILISSGFDSFSKINLSQTRKIVQNAGVPIYIIGTGELFMKMYGDQLDAVDYLSGFPGRLSMLQAKNQLNTFAKESGGAYFPYTFESQIPSILQSINALMRNQYSIGYRPLNAEGTKQRKLKVSVDVDGDGQPDDKLHEIKHRPFYNPAGATAKK